MSPPPGSASPTCQLAVILNTIQDRLVLQQRSNSPQTQHTLSPEIRVQVEGTDPESSSGLRWPQSRANRASGASGYPRAVLILCREYDNDRT